MFRRRRDSHDEQGSSEPTRSELAPGPYDSREVGEDEDGVGRVDLGSLRVAPVEGVELRLQADQASGAVASVLLAAEGAGLELRAFAAPKSGGLWEELRREIAADATRQGGTASEEEGEHGAELRLLVPITLPDGRKGRQASRIVGVEGPRWFLRGTFLGRAAQEPSADGVLEQAFRQVVVVRGQAAMPPRDQLPLRLPPEARVRPPEPGAPA